MREKKTLWKKTISAALSLVMAVGLVPAISKPLTVEAASNGPSETTFATREDLLDSVYNLNGGTAQKVAFGTGSDDEPQTWYIAGYDTSAGNLVLMCDPDKPLISSIKFTTYTLSQLPLADYPELDFDTCIYSSNKSRERVGLGHYGVSQIRTELKKRENSTDFFSAAEQGLMEKTTIYTYDKFNSEYYSTTDILYTAQANTDSYNYIMVGKNSELKPNGGVKISLSANPYLNAAGFWLRTPNQDGDNITVAYKMINSSGWVWTSGTNNSSSVNKITNLTLNAVPAFALDVSNVLFASAIPSKATTTTVSGSFSYPTTMTFRLDDNNYGKIKSAISYTENGVAVKKNPNDASTLYLCAQGNTNGTDWYYCQRITGTTPVTYNEMYTGASGSDCKIWIETTVDNVTYAQMAENVGTPKASVYGGTYTANKSVTLTTATEGAAIYYTTDGSNPDENSTRYTGPISVTGKQGQSVTTTIKAVTITADGSTSRVATYKYVINLPHVHSWSSSWTSNSTAHWHECTAANCTVTSNSAKQGYAAHTSDSGTITKAPTATTTGVKTYKCTVCGYVLKTETLPATGTTASTTSTTGTPAAKNTTLSVTASKCQVKVTSASAASPTVAYVKSTNTSAKTITIPATVTVNGVTYKVTSIAANAFKGNKKITKVTIGKNVTTIGKNAFRNCTKLKTVSMGTNVTTINAAAFYKCTALTKITIPSKVSKIGKQAFYGCKKLKTITIKTKKLTSKRVGSKAFKGIYSKAAIKVPSSKLSSYKKILKAKGVGSSAKIKK